MKCAQSGRTFRDFLPKDGVSLVSSIRLLGEQMEARLFFGALPGVAFLFSPPCNSVCQSGDKITKHSYEAVFVVGFFLCRIVVASTAWLNSFALAEQRRLPLIASLKWMIQWVFLIHDGQESFLRILCFFLFYTHTCLFWFYFYIIEIKNHPKLTIRSLEGLMSYHIL